MLPFTFLLFHKLFHYGEAAQCDNMSPLRDIETHTFKKNKNHPPVEVWAASDCVVGKVLLALLIAEVLQGIRPKQITHRPECWGLLEPVQLGHRDTNIIQNTEIHTHTHTLLSCDHAWNLSPPTHSATVHAWLGSTFFMSSKVCISGDRPPWTHRNCWFMRAAKGRQSNASIQES